MTETQAMRVPLREGKPAVEKPFGIPRPHLMLPLPQETTDGK